MSYFSEFNIYPNPTVDNISVLIKPTENSDVCIYIYDIHGRITEMKQLKNLNIQEHLLNFDLSKYHNGIYFIPLHVEKNISQKIINL